MPNTTYQKYKQTSFLKNKLHTIIIVKYKAVTPVISSMLNGGSVSPVGYRNRRIA